MATKELESKIAKLKEWEELEREAKTEIESLKDEIKAEMLDTGSGKMYFAEYKDINAPVVAMFETAAERNRWVNFKDSFSIATGTTAENAMFGRAAITGADAADLEAYIRENGADLTTSVDLNFDGLIWVDIMGGEM